MIFYFSSTGNNKYVAKRITAVTGDSVYFIPDCLKSGNMTFTLEKGENFGLILPTYCGGFPTIGIDFLNRLKINAGGDNYIFFIATYGMRFGNIRAEGNRRITAVLRDPDAIFTIRMVDNWNPMFDMTDKSYISKAESEAEPQIAETVKSIAAHEKNKNNKNGMNPISQKAATLMYNQMRHTKFFKVKDSCIGCALCEKKCPVDAIKMENGKPKWVKNKCVLCLGCVHRCPKNAISYAGKTDKHGQYMNPYEQI